MCSSTSDPILLAGLIRCPTCARIAYPIEADWLDADAHLVLVTYDRACGHAAGTTWVVAPALLSTVEPDFDPQRYAPRRRCVGTASSTRRPCRNHAVPGSDFCVWHGQRREVR